MDVKSLVQTGALYTPWPIKINDFNWKGSKFDFFQYCSDECYKGLGKYHCSHGFAYFQKKIGKDNVVVCGYVNNIEKIKKEFHRHSSNRKVSDQRILEWFDKLNKLTNSPALNTPKMQGLDALHEINRWASQIHTIAHRMLVKDRNSDFSKNFEAASSDMKALYKASTMLIDAFEYLNIFYNPESAGFGRKRSVDLYKMVDKIRIILLNAEGSSQNKKIYIEGKLATNVDLFESFKIIPFCLIQNAIKYSFDNEIIISFSASKSDVEFSVKSSGAPILEEEKDKIFEKHYRGNWSKKIHHEGAGIGLYIAKIVADVHNIKIKVVSTSCGYERNGIPVHSNTFSLKIPF